MTSCDLRWLKVSRKWRNLIGSLLEAVESQKLAYTVHFTSYKIVTRKDRKSTGSSCRSKTRVYCTFHYLQGCRSMEEAVTWRKMTSRQLRWKNVTRKSRYLTGSQLEVAVEDQKLANTVHFTSYKAVTRRRRQSPDRKWRHVTSGYRKWPGSDVIWPEVTCKWL